jgi:hypothetical protein
LKPFLVQPEKPVMPGRLTVVWFQVANPFTPMPVEVAYDVPFVPGAKRYDLPLAQIKPPATDRVLLCQWEQDVCLHSATPNPVGLGLPLVLDDTNGNGKIDLSEVTLYGNHGVGMAYLAYSAAPHFGNDPSLVQFDRKTYLGEIFTAGIAAGVHAYPLVADGFENALGAADTANDDDLALCPTQGTSCQVAPPRLIDMTNPR